MSDPDWHPPGCGCRKLRFQPFGPAIWSGVRNDRHRPLGGLKVCSGCRARRAAFIHSAGPEPRQTAESSRGARRGHSKCSCRRTESPGGLRSWEDRRKAISKNELGRSDWFSAGRCHAGFRLWLTTAADRSGSTAEFPRVTPSEWPHREPCRQEFRSPRPHFEQNPLPPSGSGMRQFPMPGSVWSLPPDPLGGLIAGGQW